MSRRKLFELLREPGNLAIIVLGWFIVCVPGLLYGLPQLLDADEEIFVHHAYKMLRPPYWDPGWYGAPASTLMDILAPLYAVVLLAGKTFGGIDSVYLSFHQNMDVYVLLGRGVTALALLGAACALYLYARTFLSAVPALAAALVFLFAPEVVSHGQIVRMDVFMILFLVLVLHFSNRIAYRAEPRHFVLAGLALGAAVTSKYPGLVGVVAIVLAAGMAWRDGTLNIRQAAGYLSLCAVSSLAAAFVLGPYLFLNMGEMLSDVIYEARSTHLSATSTGFISNLGFYLFSAIPAIVGSVAGIVGGIGLLEGTLRRPGKEVILVSVFGLCFLLFISMLSLQWVRWGLPFAVVIAVGTGVVVQSLSRSFRVSGGKGCTAAALTALIIVAPGAVQSGKVTYLKAANQDTRIAAAEWIESNVPRGARVAVETYAPQLSVEDYEVVVPRQGALIELNEAWWYRKRPPPFFGSFGSHFAASRASGSLSWNVDYIVISNWEDRYGREKHDYPAQFEVYKSIRRQFVQEKSFTPGSWQLGPNVTVFRAR
ncbi:MAG: glycosyltransferase family 39 protein [Gammaproteobacteria bacterium]|nr:glycosyltransferase family 39 protein [Gammaproteobacteria bacterium]